MVGNFSLLFLYWGRTRVYRHEASHNDAIYEDVTHHYRISSLKFGLSNKYRSGGGTSNGALNIVLRCATKWCRSFDTVLKPSSSYGIQRKPIIKKNNMVADA